MNAFTIIYDEEGNSSKGFEISNMGTSNPNNAPNFGEKIPLVVKNLTLTFSPVDENGEANFKVNTLYRKQDPYTDKWLETKNEFKKRERKHWQGVVHKRSIRR